MVKWTGIGLLAGVTAIAAGPLRAQGAGAVTGTVTGTVSVRERDGATAKDLADAVVYLTRAGAAPKKLGAAPQIAMDGREFRPHVRVVPVGSTLAFPNAD